MSSGVGGIPATEQRGSEQPAEQIHKEGTNYIKESLQSTQRTGEDQAQGNGMSASHSTPPPIREQPPASNPGSDDPTGGIPTGAGGVSGSAHVESPVPNEEQGIINTVKSFLGLSISEEKKAEDTPQSWNAGEITAMAGVGASTAAPAVAVAASRTGNTSYSQNVNDRAVSSAATNSAASDVSPLHNRSTDTAAANFSGAEPLSASGITGQSASLGPLPSTLGTTEPRENAGRFVDAGSHLNSGSGPDFSVQESVKSHSKGPSALGASTLSKSHADYTNTDTQVRQQQGEHPDEKSDHKPPKPADQGNTGKGKLENPDAIPSAGGEKLGEKHWGESQIVPENPKPRASEAGISSSVGQPTCESLR